VFSTPADQTFNKAIIQSTLNKGETQETTIPIAVHFYPQPISTILDIEYMLTIELEF